MTACPRIIVALPDAIESATIAEWLRADRFEPVRRADPRSAAGEMHARDFDLLVADAPFSARNGLLAVSRQRTPAMPIVVIGNDAKPICATP
jgi:DNA-binding response OmpR family regulator